MSPGLLSVDGLQMGLGEREMRGEMWVVKVGHMLREKKNESGGERDEGEGHAEYYNNGVGWGDGGRHKEGEGGEREREREYRIPLKRRNGSVTGRFPFI